MKRFILVRPALQVVLYTLLLAAGAVWIWASAAAPGSADSSELQAPRSGFLAPDLELITETGETISLSSLRGRPVLVNFWASWCPPCREEMPAMQRVYQEYKKEGVVILGVNATAQDNLSAALEFINSQGLDFPIVFDAQGLASRQYQVRSLPASFFVDSQGIIREVVVGGMSEALLRIRLRELLESSHAEAP